MRIFDAFQGSFFIVQRGGHDSYSQTRSVTMVATGDGPWRLFQDFGLARASSGATSAKVPGHERFRVLASDQRIRS